MTQPHRPSRLMVARAATLSAVLSVVAIALAYGGAKAMDKPLLAHDLAMAGGVLLLAGLPGLALSVWLTGKVRGGASIGFVAGIVVRLPVGGVVALNGLDWGLAQTRSFALIVAAAYLVFLAVEVVFLSPAVKRTAAAEAQAPGVDKAPGVEESV